MRLTRVLVVAAGTAALALPALPAQAAHESNNRAELSGAGVSVAAIVNYVEGREDEEWTANARVQGLAPGSYTFTVNGPAGVQTVCTFVADGKGSDGCSEDALELGGFGSAQIRDAAGGIVASGVFERRGTCRSPEQGGTPQCEANDTRQNQG